MRTAPSRFPLSAKASLTVRIVQNYVAIAVSLRRSPLPDVVRAACRPSRIATMYVPAKRLGSVVGRILKIGPWRARCILTSLVLFRLLREQGDDPHLVIGLPSEARDKDAHAWIELDGVDVGPPPGKGRHQELTRYP